MHVRFFSPLNPINGLAPFFLVAQLQAAEPVGDIIRFREPVTVANEQDVNNVIAIGSSIQIEGHVREAAVAIGGDVIVRRTGIVEGDVTAVGGRVIEETGSTITGKITSVPISIERFSKTVVLAIPTLGAALSIVIGATIVAGSLGSIALAVLTLALFPRQVGLVRREIQQHPYITPLVGFAVTLVSLPVLIFLAISLIGLPLAFLVGSALMAALVIGAISLGQWLGHRIGALFNRSIRPLVAGLLGLILLSLLSAVPYIGVLAQGLIVCYSLGAPVCARYRVARPKVSPSPVVAAHEIDQL
jgi:hypothetical protein